MADVTIERLEITVELAGAGAEAHFAQLFDVCIRRWWAEQKAAKMTARFDEAERTVFGVAGGGPF